MDKASLLAHPPFELSDADREVLGQTDAEFAPHTWDELRGVCASKDTSGLRRTPTDSWNYIRWHRHVAAQHASVSAYVREQRLAWPPDPQPRSAALFADPADYRVLRNDWPYGCEPGVVHLLAWSKVAVRVDGDGPGDPVPGDEACIEAFVRREFAEPLAAAAGAPVHAIVGERVLWFRNRRRWQSVRAVEHVHVLLRDLPEALVELWTGQRAEDVDALAWRRRAAAGEWD